MDNSFQSVHLEGNPRIEKFRQARARLLRSPGDHTIAGELRMVLPINDHQQTIDPRDVPVRPGKVACWLLDRGLRIPLKIGMNSIGRMQDNDVVIENATVSRRHCAIVVHSDLTCELHDIASKNGTLLNGKKIDGLARLKEGDDIGLSEHHLFFTTKLGPIVPGKDHHSEHSDSNDKTIVAG